MSSRHLTVIATTGERFSDFAPYVASVNGTGLVAFQAAETFRGALVSDGGAVVIIGTPRGGSPGLFAGPDPVADRILALGDTLLGSTVDDLAANPVSVNASDQVAIRARLADGRQLILRSDPR